jgi:hypothetical protein
MRTAEFIAAGEEHLHPDADAQERLAIGDDRADRAVEPALAQRVHRGPERAVAGQDRGVGAHDAAGIIGQVERRAAPFQRRHERADVPAAVVDHREPLAFHGAHPFRR